MSPLQPSNAPFQYGATDFVGGVTDSVYVTSVYDMNEFGTTARKAWFCFDKEIVCLGANIQNTASGNVITTINQALLRDNDITINRATGTLETIAATAPDTKSYTDANWVLHRNIGYYFPVSNQNVNVYNQVQTGSWSSIKDGASTNIESANVFGLYINHGASTTPQSYVYAVVPNVNSVTEMNTYQQSNAFSVLMNTAALQAVQHNTQKVLQAAFNQAGALHLNTTALPTAKVVSVMVSNPCAIIVKDIDKLKNVVSIADPTQQLTSIDVTLTYSDGQVVTQTATLPTGNYTGQSILLQFQSPNWGNPATIPTHTVAVLRIAGLSGTNGAPDPASVYSIGNPVHLDIYSISGGGFNYLRSIDFPQGTNAGIYLSQSMNEGYLLQSTNKNYLTFFGYGEKPGSGNIYNSNNNVPRTVAIVNVNDDTYDLSTKITGYPASGTAATANAAVSTNGNDLWMGVNQSTSGNAVVYATKGSTASFVGVSTGPSIRSLHISDGTLYFTSGGGNRLGKVSNNGGIPTTAGNSLTGITLSGVGADTYQPSQILAFDMSQHIPGDDVMYVTNLKNASNTSVGGVYKYCKQTDGSWVNYGSFGSTNTEGNYFGIAGTLVNQKPVLYITRGSSTTVAEATNQLIQVKDVSGYNEAMNATVTAAISAGVADNARGGLLRGVAMFQTDVNLSTPVKMGDLQVTTFSKNRVELSWQTYQEENLLKFEVEYAKNGSTFKRTALL